MNKKIPLLLAAAAVVAAVLFVVLGGGPDGPPGGDVGRTGQRDLPAPEPGSADLVGVGGAGADAARAAVDTSAVAAETLGEGDHPWAGMLAGITGRLVEETGEPVVGMRVELLEVDINNILKVEHSALGLEEPEVDEAITGEDGRFLLKGARRNAYHALNIGRGTGRATLRVVEQALEHGGLTDLGDIVLASYGTLTGTVIDEDGEPVAGARVRAAPVPEIVVQSGVLDLREGSVLAGGEEGDRKMAFDIPRRAFQLLERLPVPTTYTATDGTFRLEGIMPGTISGGADHVGLVGAPFGPIELAAGEEKDVGELELLFGREVTGQVTDGAGNPVAGVQVNVGALNPLFPAGLMQPAGVTDENGRYAAEGIPEEGPLMGIARRTRSESWTIAEAKGIGDVVDFVLATAVPITVRLRDEEGEPVRGGDVILQFQDPTGDAFGMMMAVAMLEGTDPEPARSREVEPGTYLVDGVTYGTWSVEARAKGYAPAYGEVVHSGEGTTLSLTMTRGNVIRVTVTDEATGEPVGLAHAMVLGPKGALVGSYGGGFSGPDGVAELGPLSSTFLEDIQAGRSFLGGVFVAVEHPEYGTTYEDVGQEMAFLDGALDVAVALPPSCTLSGRVHWAGENPQGLYMVVLRHDDERDPKLQMTSPPRTALTNHEGRFRFTGVAPGAYKATIMERWLEGDPISLIISQTEPVFLDDRSVEVAVDGANFLDVELSPEGAGPTGRFAGRITSGGVGVPDLEVEVRGLDEDLNLRTNSVGEFETPEISVMKRVGIRISGPVPTDDGSMIDREIYDEWDRPEAGQVTRIDLDVTFQKLRLEIVDLRSGAPVSGATVRLVGTGRRSWRGGQDIVSNDRGIADLVLNGDEEERSLTVSKDGYGTVRMTATRRDAGETMRVEMQPAVPCRGTVVLPPGRTADNSYFRIDNGGGRGDGWMHAHEDDMSFEANNLLPGTYRAEMWGGASGMIQVEFELGPNGDENLVLDFTKPIQ